MRIRWNYGIMADASYGWTILKLTVKNLRIFIFHLVLILIMFNGKSVSSSRAKWTFQDGRSKASDRRKAVFLSESGPFTLYIFSWRHWIRGVSESAIFGLQMYFHKILTGALHYLWRYKNESLISSRFRIKKNLEGLPSSERTKTISSSTISPPLTTDLGIVLWIKACLSIQINR